jgi:hypothetical protein
VARKEGRGRHTPWFSFRLLRGCEVGGEIGTKVLEALRNDAEAAADAIDEAQQQLNVLYKSIRDAHADGHSVPELERATGLHPVALQNVVDGANPPIRPTIDLL